jgi:hypothetical protein
VWTSEASHLTATGESGGGQFGYSLALSNDGNTALIGGPRDSGLYAGAAWVFTRSGGVWTQQTATKLTGAGEIGNGWFGFKVALSGDGNTALITGYQDNAIKGAAWVFTRSAGVWTAYPSKLTGVVDEAGNGGFGFAVAMSSDGYTALIGGTSDNTSLGAAWVFIAG